MVGDLCDRFTRAGMVPSPVATPLKIERRITEWLQQELIVRFDCGCALLLRTHEQISFCPTCPVQLSLPLQQGEDFGRIV